MTNQQPSFTLTGQVALVTAASKGIGRACALARQIQKLGREVLPVQMGVTRLDEIAEAVQAGRRHFKRIDILVNNAGIGAPNPAERVIAKT